MTDEGTRSIQIEQHINATPDDVWKALTTGEGLKRWFVVDAKVDPKVGGDVWISWGPGMEGGAPIHIWEPKSRFGWTEDHGTTPEGKPIRAMIDFEIEGNSGGTTLRLVQSGFSAASEWDEMYDALVDGWTYFLFHLAHCLEHHGHTPRELAWKRTATELDRESIWARLIGAQLISEGGAGETSDLQISGHTPCSVVSARAGYHFAATLPGLDNGIFFVEVEGRHVGFWLSTYGLGEEKAAELQEALEGRIEVALGA